MSNELALLWDNILPKIISLAEEDNGNAKKFLGTFLCDEISDGKSLN